MVIGIHSAKFPGEKNSENIRHAAARYRLRHPIANDSEFKIWRSYGIRAWPTLVLIDPDGNLVGGVSGEGHYDVLDRVMGQILEKRGIKLAEKPQAASSAVPLKKSDLLYPGKVAVGGEPARLFIADTGHNRIVACGLDGKDGSVFGTGERGLKDGPAAEARFHSPQGLFVDGSLLYVADTENHAVRGIDLKVGRISTIAGTGKQSRFRAGGGKATESPLNSPWDLLVRGDDLIICMAGSHQIWRMSLSKGEVGPWIGDGGEDITDGPPESARLAQPSGLALAHGRLYIADSESSGIRAFDFEKAMLESIVGTGLFDFGDGEGGGGEVLQHPLSVAVDGDEVIVADTYNHRLKRLDPKKRAVRNWIGTGKPGDADGVSPAFFEPSGLAIHAGKLYVADTNNHRVRVVELPSGKTSTLTVEIK